MAVASTAMNLATYANLANDPQVTAVTDSLIDYGNVVQDVPLITNPTMYANGARWEGNLPTVTWRQLNSEGVTSTGTPTRYQEQLYTFSSYVDVDKLMVMDKNAIGNPRAQQIAAHLKAITYDFNDKFFNNDHLAGDANAPVGLKFRITNGGTYGVRPENNIDGGGVDMSQTGMTQATANKYLELLDQALWSVDSPDGEGVVIYVNEVLKRRINFALRLMGTSGGLNIAKDQFDRTITMYKGATIRDPGYKADQATRILTTTETSDGTATTGSTYTSLYAVNYGESHFYGWQMAPINVQDLGLIYNGVTYRTLIDWAVGFMNASTRSIARIHGIKLA